MPSRAHLLLALVLAAGCSEGEPASPALERRPVLSLEQTGPRTVELRIAGPAGLRGVQGRLTWDAASLRVVKLEPGREARRIDRVIFQDPARATGGAVFGLTDTRRVLLPARGALLAARLEPVAEVGTVSVEDAVGAGEGGVAVPLEAASLEVRIR